MKIDDNLTKLEKTQIIFSTLIKLIRGLFKKPFFHSSKSLVFIGKHVTIKNIQRISVGKNIKFEDYSEIQGLSLNGLIFGDNVTIGRNTMIRPSSYYGTGKIGEGLIVGNNSSFGPNCYVGCSGKISIGNNVMFGPKCSLFAENHVFKDNEVIIKRQGVVQQGIKIEDDCWIGSNVIILDGVTVGKGSVIGAGTLVTKNIPENSIVYDVRQKKIGSRS